jgi:hypothetical protein
MSIKKIILFCIFILSRIIFINPLPVFFDSPEYLNRFSNPNFLQAITSGHTPFHVGYVMSLWPIFHISELLGLNPSYSIIFAQIIMSLIAMYCFYLFIEILTNKNTAIISTVICSLTPIYWITNVSIMTESTCINYFLISLYFFALYAKKNVLSKIHLTIGNVLLGLALLTNPLTTFWVPLIFSVIFYLKRRKIKKFTASIIFTLALVVLINGAFICYSSGVPIQNGAYQYLFGTDIAIIPNISSFTIMLFRFLRNAFIPILQNNTAIIVVLAAISLIKIFKENKKLFIVSLLWIAPAFFVNQLFDPLLFGRHGAIAGFGFGFLAAIIFKKNWILFSLIIGYLILVSLPALSLMKQPAPYLETSKFIETLPKGLFIETHFARPQIEGHYLGEITYVNQPGWSQEKLKNMIDKYLNLKKRVFISSQSLSEPYGTYSGPYLYPLSLSYAKSLELNKIIPMYITRKYAVVDKSSGIMVYEIVSKGMSRYPDFPILTYNRHTINYYDPANQLFLFILKELRLPKATT